MPTEPRLEQYLSRLDKALGPIPISERSDIITEIKSHVLEAVERDPNQDVGKVLEALGEPENVANRYLIERGITPSKPSKSPMVKWLTIGFLGTFGIAALFVLILVWRFTPLLEVDEQSGRVVMLGGLIDINEKEGHFKIGDTIANFNKQKHSFAGSSEPGKKKLIRVVFTNAKIEFEPAADKIFRWDCKSLKGAPSNLLEFDHDAFTFNLENTGGAKCELKVPSGYAVEVRGSNGKLEMNHPQSAWDVKLSNGDVEIKPDPEKNYRYDVNVVNGKSEYFASSNDKNALPIIVKVTNGRVGRE